MLFQDYNSILATLTHFTSYMMKPFPIKQQLYETKLMRYFIEKLSDVEEQYQQDLLTLHQLSFSFGGFCQRQGLYAKKPQTVGELKGAINNAFEEIDSNNRLCK